MDPRRIAHQHRTATVVAAAVAPLVVAAALSLFRGSITTTTAVLVLVALVVVAGATGIRAAGLVAALSAAAWFDFFLTAPYGSFAITKSNDLEAAALLMVIGGVVTETALWGQRQEAARSREQGYLDGVLTTAETIAQPGRSRDEVTTAVAQRIAEVLRLDTCTFAVGDSLDPVAPTLRPDGSVARGEHPVNVERDGLPVDSSVVLPVRAGGQVRGHFLLTAASQVVRPTLEARRVAVLLADEVAGSLTDPERL